jgi:hypothetical protein
MTYKDFLCEYPFDGGEWGFIIKARSHEEAQARIKQMPWAKVRGEQMMVIPVGISAWRRWFLKVFG